MAFNKREYDNNYDKEHYSQFKAKLKIEEKESLDNLLENENMTKTDFLKQSIYEFKKGKNIMMNKYDIINFLKRNEVTEKGIFREDFSAGHYSTQDTLLEKWYELEDGSFNTTVLDDHTYAYISVFDDKDEQIADGYITYKDYEELISNYK